MNYIVLRTKLKFFQKKLANSIAGRKLCRTFTSETKTNNKNKKL
jgi:hypothetical protein